MADTTDIEPYVRISLLTHEGGMWISKMILQKEINKRQRPTLKAFLTKKKPLLEDMVNDGRIREEQFKLLFPEGGNPNIDDWDLALLVKIIRNLLKESLTNEQTHDFREILDFRNDIVCHVTTKKITINKQAFKYYWERLTRAINRIARTFDSETRKTFSDMEKRLKTGPLDLKLSVEKLVQINRAEECMRDVMDFLKKITVGQTQLAEGMVSLNTKADSTNEGIVSLNTKADSTNEGIVSLNTKADSTNEGIVSLNTKADSTNEGIDSMNTKADSSQATLAELQADVHTIMKRQDEKTPIEITLQLKLYISGNKVEVVEHANDELLKSLIASNRDDNSLNEEDDPDDDNSLNEEDDPDDDNSLNLEVKIFLSDIKKADAVVSVKKGSIILDIKCPTLQSLENILSLVRMNHRLHGLEKALSDMFQVQLEVDLVLTGNTIKMLLIWIDGCLNATPNLQVGDMPCTRTLSMAIQCHSAEAVTKVVNYFHSKESTKQLNQLSEALSEVVQDEVRVDVQLDTKGFLEDFKTSYETEIMKQEQSRRDAEARTSDTESSPQNVQNETEIMKQEQSRRDAEARTSDIECGPENVQIETEIMKQEQSRRDAEARTSDIECGPENVQNETETMTQEQSRRDAEARTSDIECGPENVQNETEIMKQEQSRRDAEARTSDSECGPENFQKLKRRRVRDFLDDNSVEVGWQATIMGNEATWMALADSINQLEQLVDVIPERNEVLAAFKYCPRSIVKTVIIGHDPSPYATGLAFSYPEGTEVDPESPRYKKTHKAMRKLHDVLKSPTSPDENETSACHITWAKKGVLLLNAALTYTEASDRDLHKGIWKEFLTNLLADVLGDTFKVQGRLFVVCWGTNARELYVNLTADRAIAANRYLYLGHHPSFEMKDLKNSDFHDLHAPPPYDARQPFEEQATALFKEIHEFWPKLFTLDRVGMDE